MPVLYVVATPIGNLEDISLRALRVLREVKLIAAEDTRGTRKLLNTYGIRTPLTSFHEYSSGAKVERLVHELEKKDIALVSEAGMPGISDPGYALIHAAINSGVPVVAVPGPSALTAALAVSGLNTEQFTFLGFLPRRSTDRRRLLKSVANETRTLVTFEAPHRLRKALSDILDILGDRRMAVCRELTKVHEEVFRGTVSEAMEHFNRPRGEFTLVIAGLVHSKGREISPEVEAELRRLKARGLRAKEVASRVSEKTGLSKRKLYEAVQRLSKSQEEAINASRLYRNQ
ncbi:MAG: 16S rRNA (cytidine(1402)-2'-O)-methyltransferase [Dehalococcoidia bacterium]|nr:16S rRNA (cytidine(1402)-2'-O)-methyltransferase [Dehalococcoidia bacterium]